MPGIAYIRAKRNGKWKPVPFEHQTKEELEERFGEGVTANWLDYLAGRVRELEAFLESEGYTTEEPND